MQKPIIFNLIENHQIKNNNDLIDYIENNPACLKETFKCYNIFTYSAQFCNGSLNCIIDFINSSNKKDYIDIESTDLNGNNALHISCMNYKFNNTKFLLENGFNPNSVNKNKKSPLILLIEKSNHLNNKNIIMNFVYLLVHYNVNLNIDNIIDRAVLYRINPLIIFLLQKKVTLSNYAKNYFQNNRKYNNYILKYYKKNKKENEYYKSIKDFYKNFVLYECPLTSEIFYNKMLLYKLHH